MKKMCFGYSIYRSNISRTNDSRARSRCGAAQISKKISRNEPRQNGIFFS